MRKFFALSLLFLILISTFSIPCYAADQNIAWTDEELAFIQQHPVVRIGVDPEFIPFEFIDSDGTYKGIAADYLALISQKTGIQFEVAQGLTWPEAYDKALAGEVDVLPAISKTEEREQYFLFSDPYYFFKRVIVTRDTETEISGIEDLQGLTVAVQKNSSHHSYLLSYPKINLSLYDSVEAALTAVADGSERAFVGNLATTDYLIRSNGLTNLKFIAFEAEKQQGLYFAVRKDWPLLVDILNKTLNSITKEEKIAIQNKWINPGTEVDYGPIIRNVLIAGAFVAAVLIVSFYWIARLRKEVKNRKRVQADLERAKQEAEDANNFKSNFLARMSHEIRTPLNAITGMAYLLKKTDVTPSQRTYIDRITQASTNMLNIINDILDFSKIEAGKVELEITSFYMDQVIQDVVNIISYKLEEQKVGFKLTKDPSLPNWFFGDSKRIEQVLLNILNNAAKFTAEGEVSLDIRLTAKEDDRYQLLFTIKDTGIGMSEDQVKKLFTPFTQGDVSINRRFGGTGLGLSIVKNLVDIMGGEIRVFSTEGEGSTFVVQLSLKVDREKEVEYKKTMVSGQFKNIKTLVLEKSGANMNLIESYLGAFGMHCELTTSQTAAMSLLEAADGKLAKPYDLLIIDYDTPSEDGFRFTESVRKNQNIAQMPKIVMLLPMMRDDLFDKLSEYGVDVGIGKPIIPSVLLNGILDVFGLRVVAALQAQTISESDAVRLDKPHWVMVAEDNKTNQMISKALLKQAGIESVFADNGKAAVELYRENQKKIDLVLMDLHMPVMNGYEAAQEIRKISEKIPIAAMTADVILGVREKCEQNGMHYYISKPFDPDKFIQTVISVIRENEPMRGPNILDQTAGQKNLGGNVKAYREVLREYLGENRETAEKLSLAIKEKRYDDGVKIVHKGKSSSGSIGAKSLYEISVKLQKALEDKDEKEILVLQREFDEMMGKLLGEIADILNHNG